MGGIRWMIAVMAIAACAARAADDVREHHWLTVGEPSGGQTVTTQDDGTLIIEFNFNDRGRGPQTRTELRLDANGIPTYLHTTGLNYYKGEVDEQFALSEGIAKWRSPVESGEVHVTEPAVFLPTNSFPEFSAILARALLGAPERTLPLLPAGRVSLREVETITLENKPSAEPALGEAAPAAGGEGSTITLYAITGLRASPEYVWLDANGDLYGVDYNWFGVTPVGQQAQLATLKARQVAATERFQQELTAKLREPADGLVAITNARLFDSLTGEVLPACTVFLQDGVIAAVYAHAVTPPEEAKVLDAGGMMLLPALWDMHAHVGTNAYINYLASGVTNVRDMANDPDYILRTRRDIAAGRIAGPDIYPMGFIDKRSPFAAPTGMLAATLEEALAFVDYYAQRGFHGIKLYSSIEPEWVPSLTRKAHSLGLTVLGHIPSGMTAEQAIRAGFDEITHVNMILLNFLAGDTIDTRTPQRFIVPIREAGKLDPWSPQITDFISLMRAQGTAHDPTYSLFQQMFTNTPGEVSSLATPFIDHLPAVLARGMVSEEGFNAGLEAQGRETAQFTQALLRRLYDAGVRILPGTDWGPAGFALIRELMFYAEAGIPNADVLRFATIEPARHLGVDQQLGSVSPGKRAHLILVDGDPVADLSDLYRVEIVIKDEAMYYADALLEEIGFPPFE